MQKKAIIFDLDNTLYLVRSIGDNLFKTLFAIIAENGGYTGNLDDIKVEIMYRPFQYVANEFKFGKELKTKCLEHLKNLTYEDRIPTVEAYEYIRELPCQKFLVTTGFTKLQNSKIEHLGIKNDFDKIHIIDPAKTAQTKRDIFKKILIKYNFLIDEVLVVGDDPNSEIKAAKELGLDSVLYDFNQTYTSSDDQKVIRRLSELEQHI
jgi:putative hydrolase of the HAD superfamily